MRTYGVQAIRDLIRDHIKWGQDFAGHVRARPDLFEIITTPAFALTVFTIANPRSRGEGLERNQPISRNAADQENASLGDARAFSNDIAKEVCEEINARGEIYLTSAIVDGVYAIRVVSSNPLAEEKYLHMAFDILVSTTEETLSRRQLSG